MVSAGDIVLVLPETPADWLGDFPAKKGKFPETNTKLAGKTLWKTQQDELIAWQPPETARET